MARPEHKPTAASKRQVAAAAGGGMRQEDIANALGISVPTLRKHYDNELSAGAAKERMAVLQKVLAQAKKGSTSAARLYLAQQPEFQPVTTPAEDEKPAKVGKKEQQQAAAVDAESGTGWDGVLPKNVVPIAR